MSEDAGRNRNRRRAAMAAGALFAGAFDAMHGLTYESRINPVSVTFTVVIVFVELALLTATFDLVLRRRRSPTWAFALSGAVALGTGVAETFAGWGFQSLTDLRVVGSMNVFRPVYLTQLGVFTGLLSLGLWAIAVVVPFAVRDAQARVLEAAQLRTAAELANLRARLQPHFLLNTLSTVSGLVTEDPREARKLIGALGDLLRDSFEDAGEMQTLEREVEWLKRYAEILETRYRGLITFEWDIAVASLQVRVPRLLLQPLLENAVTHGALRRREGGVVTVRTSLADARATCIVEDNGPGPKDGTRNGARGLELVTRRLAVKYAGDATFRLEAVDGCTRSIVELPVEVP